MIAGARLLWFVISFTGFISALLGVVVWLWLRPQRRTPLIALLLVVGVYSLLGSYALAERGANWLASPFQPLSRADVPAGRVAIVLLGSGSWTFMDWQGGSYSTLDPIGLERALEAARAYRLLDARWIISSGGSPDPDDPDQPSGLTMREFLISVGVPADRVLEEHASRTTREEAVITARMLREIGAEHVVLVTSGMHMRRSLAVFRSVGLHPIPAIAHESFDVRGPVARWLPSIRGLEVSGLVVHELVGLAYYRMRGWQQ